MVRVFKIIMNILMILMIAAMCAVFVPPFVGITTAVASEGSESNIPTGAIVYATREAFENLEVGEDILITSNSSFYIYEITEIDETNNELTVRTSESSETEIVQLSRAATKIIIVVPVLGYILLALQSFVGFVILAVTCALIIILFIIATVLKNQAAYEEDEEDLDEQDEDIQYFQDLAAEASKPSELDKLGTFSIPELDAGDVSKTEETQEVSNLMVDSTDEPPSAPQDELGNTIVYKPIDKQEVVPAEKLEGRHIDGSSDEPKNESDLEVSIAAKLLSDIEAFESSFKEEKDEQDKSPVSDSDTKDTAPSPDIKEPVKSDESDVAEVELAIPVRSLDDLLQEAYAKGEDPQVTKDEVTGTSFVDYSSCF